MIAAISLTVAEFLYSGCWRIQGHGYGGHSFSVADFFFWFADCEVKLESKNQICTYSP